MKKTIAICLGVCLCVVLLCACGSRGEKTPSGVEPAPVTAAPVDDGIATEPAPTEAPTPEPPVVTEGDEELASLLLAIRDEYRPGTAGSSLTAIRLAAQIMDWYNSMGSVNLAVETMMALGDPGADAAGTPYAEKLEAIYTAAVGLWGYSGEMALADCGYEAKSFPYPMSDVREIFDALYSGLAGGTTAPVYVRAFRSDDNAERFLISAVKVESVAPESVIQALKEVGVLNEAVAIQLMEYTENGLHIDLNEAFRTQLCSYGTTGEYMLVGALVNTFLQNYSAESLILTVDNVHPESGHVIYDFPMTMYNDNVAVG